MVSKPATLRELQKFAQQYEDEQPCPVCGERYRSVGQHISKTSAHGYPEMDKQQRDIIIGCLLGDGTLHEDGYMVWYNTALQAVAWVASQLGWMTTSVATQTTEEIEQSQTADFEWQVNEPRGLVTSMKHPTIVQLRNEWYSSDGRRYQNDFEMTPTILKLWYAGDGWLNEGTPRIRNTNGDVNQAYLDDIFSDSPFEARVLSDESIFSFSPRDEFFRYAGEPLPGFGYKWPGGEAW